MMENTVGELLKERAQKSPRDTALEFMGEFLTFRELDEYSDILAENFRKNGIGRGSMAGLWCANQTGWILVYFGLQKCGAATVLLNPECQAEELQKMLCHTDIEYLFCGEESKGRALAPVLEKINRAELPKLKEVIPVVDAVSSARELSHTGQQPSAEKDKTAFVSPTPKEISTILFTSGTSADPKGVMLSHFSIVNAAAAAVRVMGWSDMDKICVIVPLFHCFGLVSCLLAGLIAGSTLHLLPHYRTKKALEAISTARCTVINGVPTMFLAMAGCETIEDYDMTSLRSGIIAGSLVSPEEYCYICKKLKIRRLQMSYGQTETSAGVTFSKYWDSVQEKSDNAGYPIENTQICIRNGEIVVKGFGVMSGYYGRLAETEEVLGRDGWLHTGDMGYIDKKGCLHIKGRKNEIIVRGGENISPAEIEECLKKLRQIRQVKVVGIPHKVLQEEIAACVVMEEGFILDQDEIREYAGRHLAACKIPEYILEFPHFPLSSSGKIETGRLKEQVEEKINELKQKEKAAGR